MSVATSTAISLAVAAGTGAAGVYGSHESKVSNDAASAASEKGSAAQLDYLKQKDAQDQANWEKTYGQNLAEYQAKEERLAPYRDVGTGAATTLHSLMRPPTPYGVAAPGSPAAVAASAPPTMTPRVSVQRQVAGPSAPGQQLMWDPSTGRLVPVAATNLRQLTAGVA